MNKHLVCLTAALWIGSAAAEETPAAFTNRTLISIRNGRWFRNHRPLGEDTPAQGFLMNVRMVNVVFEDFTKTEFDPDTNTQAFIDRLPEYIARGIQGFTISLQGGMPGYEGAVNTAFARDGSLQPAYLERVRRCLDACDRQGAAVILSCFYQRQSARLDGPAAYRAGVSNVVQWLRRSPHRNVVLEIGNEYPHSGFQPAWFRTPEAQVELILLARSVWPDLLISTSGCGDAKLDESVARASNFLLIHLNDTPLSELSNRLLPLRAHGKPIVCNEDDKTGEAGAQAAATCVQLGLGWGLMLKEVNQRFPFRFRGPADDPVVYERLHALTRPVAVEREGTFALEAEHATSRGWRPLAPPLPSTSGLVMQPAEPDARLEFDLAVSAPGTWHVWIRTLAADAANNGLFLELDGRRIVAGSEDQYPGVEPIYLRKDARRFHWRPEWQGPGEGNHAGPIQLTIASAGRHRLALVRRRTEAPLVDGIALTRAAEPPWLATPDLPGPLPAAMVPPIL